jgi:excisionase family DNA binding protein
VEQGVSTALSTLSAAQTLFAETVKERIESLPHVPSMGHAARLLTLDEVAEFLVVTRAVVDSLVAAGSLRVVRIGVDVRVRPTALQAFLEWAEK